jgi:hypothetical protein
VERLARRLGSDESDAADVLCGGHAPTFRRGGGSVNLASARKAAAAIVADYLPRHWAERLKARHASSGAAAASAVPATPSQGTADAAATRSSASSPGAASPSSPGAASPSVPPTPAAVTVVSHDALAGLAPKGVEDAPTVVFGFAGGRCVGCYMYACIEEKILGRHFF